MSKEIFDPVDVLDEMRDRERPLGALSDFVVEKLPTILDFVSNGNAKVNEIEHPCRELVSTLPTNLVDKFISNPGVPTPKPGVFGSYTGEYTIKYPYAHLRDIAGLDLKMLEAAIIHNDGIVPDALRDLIGSFAKATQQPPVLTYEELVSVNPKDVGIYKDMRHFREEEIGKSERAFYEGHHDIEGRFYEVILFFERAIRLLGERKIPEAANEITMGITSFRAAIATLKNIGQSMPPEYFDEFRKYLAPYRGFKGPSGAFTPGIPLIEAKLMGDVLPDERFDYIEINNMYFPRYRREDLLTARDKARAGRSILALTQRLGNPHELQDQIQKMDALIRAFRNAHYKAVKRQIPGAIEGKVSGTGGEQNPGEFLRERMKKVRLDDSGKPI